MASPSLCFLCGQRPMERGAICWSCLDPLRIAWPSVLPEIIPGALMRASGWLIDGRGAIYPVGPEVVLGRRTPDLAILHPKVSRQHARLLQAPTHWTVTDLESRHGTWVDGERVHLSAPLRPGQTLRLGPVALIFSLTQPSSAHLEANGEVTVSTASLPVPVEEGAPASPQPPAAETLRLVSPIPGGFGSLSIHDVQVALSPLQCALMEMLLERLHVDRDRDAGVRGYVSSAEMLVSLPWETPYPQPEALKQLIRRSRLNLKRCGLEIEAHRGLGYRLVLEHAASPP